MVTLLNTNLSYTTFFQHNIKTLCTFFFVIDNKSSMKMKIKMTHCVEKEQENLNRVALNKYTNDNKIMIII